MVLWATYPIHLHLLPSKGVLGKAIVSYYGHMTRKSGKKLIQGCTPGNRSRGRQRRHWTDDIVEWTGLAINEAAGLTQDRDRWTGILRATNPSSGGRH